MLDHDDFISMEELPMTDPAELLRAMPELRLRVDPDPPDELGLRSILEHDDALLEAWSHVG